MAIFFSKICPNKVFSQKISSLFEFALENSRKLLTLKSNILRTEENFTSAQSCIGHSYVTAFQTVKSC